MKYRGQVENFLTDLTQFLDNHFILVISILGFTMIMYLFVALYCHRRDQKRLMELGLKHHVDVRHTFSWRGVTAELHHPTGRGKEKVSSIENDGFSDDKDS